MREVHHANILKKIANFSQNENSICWKLIWGSNKDLPHLLLSEEAWLFFREKGEFELFPKLENEAYKLTRS